MGRGNLSLINKRFLFTWLLLGCILLTLNSCGFRLRGSAGVIVPLPATYVAGDGASAVLLADLRRGMRDAGVVLVGAREDSRAVLAVTGEEKDRRVLSVGSTGAAQEYELRYAVTFTVTDHEGKEILPGQTIERLRAVSFNAAQVLAKESEEELLYRELRREVVQGMVRRLGAIGK